MLNVLDNFNNILSLLDKLIDLLIKFCNSIKTKPTPNSTAEKIRKKKVNDNIFKLSYDKPKNKVNMYKVIQSSSAVKSKCNDVLVFINMLKNKIKKKIIIVLKSPHNKLKIKIIYQSTRKNQLIHLP